MRITVDDTRCVGHGRCYATAPDLFEPDDYGHAHVIQGALDGDVDTALAERAMRACPEDAITIEA